MPYVFISYVRENQEAVHRIKTQVEALGVEVWIDTQNIRLGQDWKRATRQGIEGSSRFLACFSRDFRERDRSPMHDELQLAAEEAVNRTPDLPWILPVLLSPCVIPDLPVGADKRLDRLHRIELHPDWEGGIEKLLAELQPLAAPPPIIVLGSGNGDFVLTHSVPIVMGAKNFVDSKQFLGGSGLNATSRLLAAGYHANPILSVGPDHLGELVRDHLRDCSRYTEYEHSISSVLDDESFFATDVKTPQSTIVVDGDRRTIFAEKLAGGQHYYAHVLARLKKIMVRGDDNVAALLVGHIHTDGRFTPDGVERDAEQWGQCTRYLVDRFAGKCPIFLNFGRNQIDLGVEFWEKELRRASMVQLNLAEAKRFFRHMDGVQSTYDAFEWFRERQISFVLTFGRFGAAATFRSGTDGAVMVWPAIEKHEVEDTTGAGDAFAAGCVSVLQGRLDWTFTEFLEALGAGRMWAGYACRKLGACNEPPGKKVLAEFGAERVRLSDEGRIRNVEVLGREDFRKELRTIDVVFDD